MTPRDRYTSALFFALTLLCALGTTGSARAQSDFVTFETGQVRPLALSPDGTRLYALNTPDNRLEIFDVATTVGALTHVGSVTVGLEPIAVAARNDDEVWVVNHLSDSVSIVDVSDDATAHVVRTLLVGDEPRDIVFGGTCATPGPPQPLDCDRAFITTAHRGQNTPLHPTIETVLITEGIGRADVWVFNVASLGSSLGGDEFTVVTLFGDTPRALAVSTDGATVYAAVFHSGNRSTALSEGVVPNGGEGAGGLPDPTVNHTSIPGPEVGLIVQHDGVAWRDELGRSWNGTVKFSLPDEDVFAIDADAGSAGAMATPVTVTAGVGTILMNMIVNPDNDKVYVSNLESFNRVRFEGPGTFAAPFKPLGEPSSVRGHLAESRITVVDGATATPIHLNKHIDYDTCCAPLPNAENDDSIGFPVGMAISDDGDTLYVAAFGSSEIAVYDTGELEGNTFTPDADDQIPLGGGGPTGLALDEPRSQLYVLTRFDNSVRIVSTATGTELDDAALHNPEPEEVVVGRPFLYDTAFSSSHGDSSCASCHIFGDFDSLAWDLGDPDGDVLNNPGPFTLGPFIDPDFHPMKGPMTTQSLRGMANHGPMHWRGDRTGGNDEPSVQPDSGAFDEVAAFMAFNPAFEGLIGRDEELENDEMLAFTDFILNVTYPPNPIRNLDNSFTTQQDGGDNIYFGPVTDSLQNCNGCHRMSRAANEVHGVDKPGFFGGDGQSSFENEPQILKIPHLRNMYQKVGMFGLDSVAFFNPGDNGDKGPQIRGFGFLHDGSVDTLFRFHNATVFNQSFANLSGFPVGPGGDPQRRQVEALMMAFDTNLFPIVGQQITRDAGNGATVDPRIDLMIARANSGECDVVARLLSAGEDRGYVYLGSGLFQSDRDAEAPINTAALKALSTAADREVTFTAVPPGSGERIGVDRDRDGFFDHDELDAGSDPTDPLSVPDVCGADPDCVKCERSVAKEAAKLAKARSKALTSCERRKVKGSLSAATVCATEPTTANKLAKASSKMGAKIDKACGGADKVCDGDADEDIPAVLGWGGFCPNFEGGACDMAIADCGDIADCLDCINSAATSQANDLYFGDLLIPTGDVELRLCQEAIGKEAQKFQEQKGKILQKCWDQRLTGKHADTCPNPAAAVGTPARKAADNIAQAESKKVAKICKACGGDDGLCDGIDDLDPQSEIGFQDNCNNVTIPGGASCAGAVTTLDDLVECVDCVTEFKVDCMDRAAVPEFETYPAECNP